MGIVLDFIIGLLQGKDCIYVVVDRITKYARFHVISLEYKAPQVVDLFFRDIFRFHWLPRTIARLLGDGGTWRLVLVLVLVHLIFKNSRRGYLEMPIFLKIIL